MNLEMKKAKNRKIMTAFIVVITLVFQFSFAHSGRTDGSGGHRDNRNASGLGYYHYHHGMHAHLHTNGICPYSPKDTISVSNMPSEMLIGDSRELEWTVTYYSGSGDVEWTSSDSEVLTVSQLGVICAHKEGTVTLTADMKNGQRKYKIKIKPIYATEIKLDNVMENLEIGKTLEVNASVLPFNTTNKYISWTSNNEKVAKVDENGKITALEVGEAVITASAVGGKKESFSIMVYENYPEEIVIDSMINELELFKSHDLKGRVLPLNTTFPNIEWKSSDESIVTVNNGEIYGHVEGEAVITAKCKDVSVDIPIKLYSVEAESINIDKKSMNYICRNYLQLNKMIIPEVIFAPTNTTYKEYKIISSDENVVEVQGNELYTKSEGITNIIVTNGTISDTIEIKVINVYKYILIVLIFLIYIVLIITTTIKFIKKKMNKKKQD